MRHAYLILCHSEFDLLRKLISTLDDDRNDIFIHVDKKVKILPEVHASFSKVYFVENRIDVCWGDVSVVEAEYELFELAYKNGRYSYFHLMSGVDLPLKSQDDIHDFFSVHSGLEFIGFNQDDYAKSLDRKVNRFHLFAKDFRYDYSIIGFMKKALRAIYLRFQLLFNIRRNVKIEFKKGTQWISVTQEFVEVLLSHKGEVLRIYQNTFCADEIFVQTLCWNSDFRSRVYNLHHESIGAQRKIGWQNNVILDWEVKDFDALVASNLLFARKFSTRDLAIVDKILNHIK